MNNEISRRMFVLSGLAIATTGCAAGAAPRTSAPSRTVNPQFRRKHVRYDGSEAPGTIMVRTSERFLYFVEGDGWATRYGVGVGEEGLSLKGHAVIGRKEQWPSWTPTANMMRRKPHLVKYAGGVPGGLNNPLGARALYLYRGGKDTMFRLHGTNEPWTIGTAVSSGCIRLTNDDIVHLYDRVPLGTDVIVV